MQGGSAKIFDFARLRTRADCIYYPNTLNVSKKIVTLHMGWELEIHNRINIGFALGWSYYGKDEEHDWVELSIYLGLISIIIKY